MSLPWIVIVAAFILIVLWQSGVFERPQGPRPPRPPRLPDTKGKESDRLRVFEDYLRALGEDDRPPRPEDKPHKK
jgi:hypothetical protein